MHYLVNFYNVGSQIQSSFFIIVKIVKMNKRDFVMDQNFLIVIVFR